MRHPKCIHINDVLSNYESCPLILVTVILGKIMFFPIFLCTSFLAVVVWTVKCFHPKYIAGQSLSIGRIALSTLTLYDVNYAGTLPKGSFHFKFSACSIRFQFHIPTPSLPRWLILVMEGVAYTSETGDISVDRVITTLWVFPVLFKQTAGPWANTQVDGVRVHIPSGKSTPSLVKTLRENLVSTLTCGDIFQLDDFGTKVSFVGLAESPDGTTNDCQHLDTAEDDEQCQQTPPRPNSSSHATSNDELRISSFVRGLHLYNNEGRIYTFGEVEAQFRRNWIEDRGSFVLVAKECRWVKVHEPHQRLKLTPAWAQFPIALARFPFDLFRALGHPRSTINLYITQVDVTFDQFRIRDAELVMQMIGILGEKSHLHDIQWQDIFADALAQCLLGFIS